MVAPLPQTSAMSAVQPDCRAKETLVAPGDGPIQGQTEQVAVGVVPVQLVVLR